MAFVIILILSFLQQMLQEVYKLTNNSAIWFLWMRLQKEVIIFQWPLTFL